MEPAAVPPPRGVADLGRLGLVDDRRYRVAMAEIESEIMAGRFGLAVRNLDKLLAWKPDPDGGLAYLLGCCEQSRGKNEAAVEAGCGSRRVRRTRTVRSRPACVSSRMAGDSPPAETASSTTRPEDPRNDSTALLTLLVPIYEQQGRIDEAERLLEARWERWNELGEGASEPAIKLVRQHIDLTLNPRRSRPSAPSSTRPAGWLPRTIGSGWVERTWRSGPAPTTRPKRVARRCLRGRAEDVPVWRARLNWGIATGRIDVVQEALTHLPASESTPAQVHRLKAWLAANRGDVADRTPGAGTPVAHRIRPIRRPSTGWPNWRRRSGQPARAAELLRKKREIDRLRARYEKLHERKQPVRDAVEMAHLAEQLGRVFEARAFLTLAISEDPDREDLRRNLERLSPGPRKGPEPGQTLAQVLADESLSRLILPLCTIE